VIKYIKTTSKARSLSMPTSPYQDTETESKIEEIEDMKTDREGGGLHERPKIRDVR
jgi:hypothetical protein